MNTIKIPLSEWLLPTTEIGGFHLLKDDHEAAQVKKSAHSEKVNEWKKFADGFKKSKK